jgi:DNA-binding transcriptional MerR regulator
MRTACLPGRPSASGLGGNQTSGSGTDREKEQTDRKEGEASARACGPRIVAHVPRVKQRKSHDQRTTGHDKVDERLGTHARRDSVERPLYRPDEQPNGTAPPWESDLDYTDSDSETVTIRHFRMSVDIRFGCEAGHGDAVSDDRDGRTDDGRQRTKQSRSRGTRVSRSRVSSLPVGSAAIGTKTPEPYRYTMADLEAETGLSARTIRFYITQGLLPAARGRGVGATYGPTHLLRLKAIGLLKKDNSPLEQIRQRLQDMRDPELAAMLEVETAPPEDRWRRVHLHPDLELHVREQGGRNRNYTFEKVVDLIVKQSEILIDQQLRDAD